MAELDLGYNGFATLHVCLPAAIRIKTFNNCNFTMNCLYSMISSRIIWLIGEHNVEAENVKVAQKAVMY